MRTLGRFTCRPRGVPRRPRALAVALLAAATFGAACAGEQPKHLGLTGNQAAVSGDATLGGAPQTTTTTLPSAAGGEAVVDTLTGAGTAAGSAPTPGSPSAAASATTRPSGPGAVPGAATAPAGNTRTTRPAASGGPAPTGLGASSAAAPASGNGGATDVGVTADTIKLGGFFIESGPVGELGITLLKSVKAVFNEVNAAGGIYGRKLQMVDCDTSFTSGDKPRACYTKLTQQDKIFAFAATGDGPAWVTAAPLACKDQIPALWTDGLSQNEFTCPTIFPTGPAGRSQARVLLDYYIKAKKPKTVGILAQNDDIGNEWLVGAKEVLGKYGVRIVAEEKYNLGETNFTTQVTNMRFANPDFVFFSSEPLGPILFQKTAEGQGWKPPMPSAGV
ncbi:MAG TPA: ABC transporter substrate-binding protein, partial [Acidimicrobiia bacterium]|nr:ABC transporter substrate-binding protein [Acidimicrobiia bacterium]